MSDDNQKSTIKKQECSGSAEAPLLSADKLKELEEEFFEFMDEHSWSSGERAASTYSFYHMLNVIKGTWVRKS